MEFRRGELKVKPSAGNRFCNNACAPKVNKLIIKINFIYPKDYLCQDMYLEPIFPGRATGDNKARSEQKTILHIGTKGEKTQIAVWCVFLCCGEKNRMLCHYGKRSLGHEQGEASSSTSQKGLQGKEPGGEKKREKELLQNIFHQLGMLSWDWIFMFWCHLMGSRQPGNVECVSRIS